MHKNLVIVESPAKAKTIEKFLGKDYKVMSSYGHIRDLKEKKFSIDIENHYTPIYEIPSDKKKLVESLREEAAKAETVWLASDEDREGEAIAWHLTEVLGLPVDQTKRIVFHEITKRAILEAIEKPRTVNMDLVNAQQARRILDRLVGFELSPVLWKKVRPSLSAGRVQSVAVRLIDDREKEIESFKPEEYWTLDAQLLDERSHKTFTAHYYGKNGKKFEPSSREEIDAVIADTKSAVFAVKSVKRADKQRSPSPPFTTSTLQQEASRKLNMTPRRTMAIAQQLYEGVEIHGKGTTGLITYIRTDSVRIADEAQKAALEYISDTYGKDYVPKKPNIYKGRKGAQDAHEAIRPADIRLTPQEAKASLNASQYKLYKLIYERFIASQMTEAKLETTSVSFDANGCTYRATGTKVLFPGYTAIYTEGRDDSAEEEAAIPTVSANDIFRAEKVEKEQKFSQPPARYTEASLVKLLEEKGIGRPSTYAPTISTIIERGYVRREKKQLVPTELGFVVTKIMKENFSDIVDIKFTADMESKLDLIKDGEEPWKEVIREFYGPFEKTLEKASESIEKVVIPDEVSDIKCEKCGSMMVYKMGRFGKFLACPNFPNCRNTKAIVEKTDVKCPLCGGEIIKRKSKKGKVFYGCEKYPECSFVSWDKPVKEKCPKCGGLMVHKTGHGGGFDACIAEGCGYTTKQSKQDKKGSEE